MKTEQLNDYEMEIFGTCTVQTASLYQRLRLLEKAVDAHHNFDSLSDQRFKFLQDAIKSKRETIEGYEVEVFGEVREGPLNSRMKKLEEWE